ncbi:hypothetical protein RHO14_04235 [Orbus wheelerorum]
MLANAQAMQIVANSKADTVSTNQPVLSNLAENAKIWHLHPVRM